MHRLRTVTVPVVATSRPQVAMSPSPAPAQLVLVAAALPTLGAQEPTVGQKWQSLAEKRGCDLALWVYF